LYSRKVLIADPAEEFRDALVTALSPSFQVILCHQGDEIPALLIKEQPDLLILELALPGLDGISLLEQLPQRPPVLVVSDSINTYTHSALLRLNVEYAIRKPAPIASVVNRAMDLIQTVSVPQGPACLLDLLVILGLPSGRQGFRHLLTGLPLLARNRDQQLSKELYDTIARLDHSTAGAVEKAIRDIIREGWYSGDRKEWNRLFPGLNHCPRNKEFLFRIADLIREQQLCG
jgi:CheY-like chemotaxis protein